MVDYVKLRASTQAYRLDFSLLTPRSFQLIDVDFEGNDQGAPVGDPAEEIGEVGYLGIPEVVQAFEGIRDLTISGSIDSGFSIPLTVPQVPAPFEDYFGVDLRLTTWHGNIPGVIGGSGTDPDSVLLCRGYMTGAQSQATAGMKQVSFNVQSSVEFLKQSSFSRGIDYAEGLGHGAPGSPADIIFHIIQEHTNYSPRSNVGVYLPAHDLGTNYSLSKGSVYSMVKQVADNACLIGWVYSDREDNLQVTGHPNMVGDIYPGYGDPLINLADDIILEWDISDRPARQCAQCTISIVTSAQVERVVNYYYGQGLGSRDSFTIKTDDDGVAEELAARYVAHANRRYSSVRVRVPLNVAADLGNIVSCTTEPQYNNRGISWSYKQFVVTGVEYAIETQEQRFSSWLTLDEVVG